jgi:sterol desaturase/sphingolipid hydroxylase (fatty acid hydroxylase superfamily)
MNPLYQKILWLFSLPVYFIIIPFEILLSNFTHKLFYSWKETFVNIYLNLLNIGVDLALRFFVGFTVLFFFYGYHLNISWNPLAYWVVLLFGEDLLFWVEHYIDHKVRLFWAVHVTHHSSPEYNLSTGFRSSVLMPVYKYFYFIPLMLLNFKPMDVIFIFSITQIYGILVHTQSIKKLPAWIEYVFVTPSHHRVHHASNIPYRDRNMGMTLIIWDRMFGTFTEEMDDEAPQYGISKPIANPYHPVQIVTHEWAAINKDLRRARGFRLKLKYLLMPPGWSEDGSTKTSKELQAAYNKQDRPSSLKEL